MFAPKLACVGDVQRTFTVAMRTFIAMRTMQAAHTWPREVISGDSTSYHCKQTTTLSQHCDAPLSTASLPVARVGGKIDYSLPSLQQCDP